MLIAAFIIEVLKALQYVDKLHTIADKEKHGKSTLSK